MVNILQNIEFLLFITKRFRIINNNLGIVINIQV